MRMESSKIHSNAGRQIPTRASGNSKSGSSGRYGSKNSPSGKRLRSTRRDSKGVIAKIQCLRTNRVVFGLILIALWGYLGFHFQSQWAHNDSTEELGYGFGFGFRSYNTRSPGARLQEEIKKAEALLRKNSTEKKDLNVNEIKIVTLATQDREVSNPKAPILKQDLDTTNIVNVTSRNEEKKANSNAPKWKTPNLENDLNKNKTKDTVILEIKATNSQSNISNPKPPKLETSSDSNNTKIISNPNPPEKKKRKSRKNPKPRVINAKDPNTELEEGLIPKKNSSYGLTVGPFGETEDAVLQWSPNKKRGPCDKNGDFAKTVFSRTFVLIFHELSMTGAPLSMMELASELLSCGAHVSVVVVNRKGGLLSELENRGIKVIKDRMETSFKAAFKADLVIAGSTVCSSWIEQYLSRNPLGSNKILWWIMENRREYFERSMNLLNKVKMLAFLSEYQLKKWVSWCEKENIKLISKPMLVPLSVNDELAFVAGIKCSLNSNLFNVDTMNEKRMLLRNRVRGEMGLGDNDVLVLSLSSINPGKGQKLLLEASLLVVENEVSLQDFEIRDSFDDVSINETIKISSKIKEIDEGKNLTLIENNELLTLVISPLNQTNQTKEIKIKDLIKENGLILITPLNQTIETKETRNLTIVNPPNQTNNNTRFNQINIVNTSANSTTTKRRRFLVRKNLRNLLNNKEEKQNLKVLIGSLGSKSNKVPYIKAILMFITQHGNMSNMVMWTPATTRVASLYAAADLYVINAQGIGETFGRVTVEAMAFGLPVLGTDAGGTREIVQDKVTGLLHSVGRDGIETLAENLLYLLSNKEVREKMGQNGRQLVIDKYLKNNTYDNFAQVLSICMRS